MNTVEVEANDRAWAEGHGIELDPEFCLRVGALLTPGPTVMPPVEHTEHRVERRSNVNWAQFTDPGTQIVRGRE